MVIGLKLKKYTRLRCMSKNISTLVEDINNVILEGVSGGDYKEFGREFSDILCKRLDADEEEKRGGLRLSSIGVPCARQLWYRTHTPDEREPFGPNTLLKFLYGDLIESLVLELARKAGHLVEGEQDTILVNGIEGHRDCIIDGVTVDVKSASTFSFRKFKAGLQRDDDSFGYLTQLQSYVLGGRDDPRVKEKYKGAFLVLDKTTGHLCLDVHTFTEEDFEKVRTKISERKTSTAQATPPDKAFDEIPEGKSGNLKLGVNCSYCAFKQSCWPELRTFVYSGGRPVFLTHVEREPNVPEVTKDG